MAQLDVESLFPYISLDESIDSNINDLFCAKDKVHNIEMDELKQLLKFAAYEFLLDGQC